MTRVIRDDTNEERSTILDERTGNSNKIASSSTGNAPAYSVSSFIKKVSNSQWYIFHVKLMDLSFMHIFVHFFGNS